MIKGGYVLQARKTDNSSLAFKPPHFREIFNWLYRQANHKENGEFKRGQCFRSIRDIQEGLKWYVGYRKSMYSKSQCENALNWLRNETMITTTKTTRGMLITICNYDTYQDPTNYEGNSEQTTKATTKTETPVHYKQECINNDKNKKNINKENILSENDSDELLFSELKTTENKITKTDSVSILTFDEFWNIYDKKEGKAEAEKKYSKISENDRKLIKETISYYLQKTPDKKFRKLPVTYLNSKIWLDEIEVNNAQNNPQPKAVITSKGLVLR